MSDERLLAFMLAAAAALGGGAQMMRTKYEAPTRWMEVHWPAELKEADVAAFLRNLASDRASTVIVFETVVHRKMVSYRLGIPRRLAESLPAALKAFVPDVSLVEIASSTIPAPTYAWELGLSTTRRSLRVDDADSVARSILGAITTAHEDETVVLQWLLGPRLKPERVGAHVDRPTESVRDLVRLVSKGPAHLDGEEKRALTAKVGDSGFRVIGRFGVAGASERRARSLASRLISAIRTAEAPGVQITDRRTKPSSLATAAPNRDWPMALNVREMAALTGWPLGSGRYPSVRGHGSSPLPVRKASRTRLFASSTFPGDQRDLGLSARDALQHLHVLGPTGVGKSTLLLNLICRDIEDGRGVIVIDPKGDLIADITARIPAHRQSDVVVFDPTDDEHPVGMNVLRNGRRSPELVADQVLAVFHGLYADSWGPRTQDILHASLLSLASLPGMTLCAVPVLLSNERFRALATQGITDEIALKPFWRWFNNLTEGERAAAIAPVMNKLRAFLLRPRMRSVIGQADPKFDLEQLFTERRIVLVSLAKGTLGPEAAGLLGSLFVSQLWQATLGRVTVPAEKRRPVMAYIDEFQDYLHLPTDLTDVLAQARGLGLGLTLAHQHLGQLTPAIRSAVLANARSRICFQLGAEDARVVASMAREVAAEDLQTLPRFEAYASLVHDGAVMPYASIRTWAPPEATSDPAAVRQRSRVTYGTPVADIERELAALVQGDLADDDRPIGRRRKP